MNLRETSLTGLETLLTDRRYSLVGEQKYRLKTDFFKRNGLDLSRQCTLYTQDTLPREVKFLSMSFTLRPGVAELDFFDLRKNPLHETISVIEEYDYIAQKVRGSQSGVLMFSIEVRDTQVEELQKALIMIQGGK